MSESQLGLMEVLLRMRLGEHPKLTPEEVEAWLGKEGRSAANLPAARRLLNDPALLEEAARKFPNDARVQMDVLLKGLFPGDRHRWVEAFKRNAPAKLREHSQILDAVSGVSWRRRRPTTIRRPRYIRDLSAPFPTAVWSFDVIGCL